MADIFRAMAISGAILIAVFVLITVIAFVIVRRGEVEMAKDGKGHGHSSH